MADEFNIIKKFFTWDKPPASVITGVGDDAAVLETSKNKRLVVSTDTLVSGVHFPEDTDAHAIGHKSLAVNLSDLAAMGADPAWFTLSLTLPSVNEDWLDGFSNGLKTLAKQHDIYLIGGDTSRGPLSISIQIMGFCDDHQILLRSGANHGDKVYVTGTLGDAAAGLQVTQNTLFFEPQDATEYVSQLDYPQPRNASSRLIRGFASSCIDISDGLLADLQHILDASKMGASINTDNIPLSPTLKKLNREKALELALTGGDDYELLFTLSPLKEHQLTSLVSSRQLSFTCIGTIDKNISGVNLSPTINLKQTGFNHFS